MYELLIDFDNVAPGAAGAELQGVMDHLLARFRTSIPVEDIHPRDRVNARFYGGWFEDQLLTRRAQDLTAAIQGQFPMPYRFRCGEQATMWTVTAELAVSLVSAPSVHLLHTYRQRQTLAGIRVADPADVGCDPTKCGIRGIKDFVKKGKCPDCDTPANLILWRAEQKLVDVMLASDFTSLAGDETKIVCLVSSDDDFWPVLLHTATTVDRPLYHIHAKQGRRLPDFYTMHAPSNYREIPYEEMNQ